MNRLYVVVLVIALASCAKDPYANLEGPRKFFERQQVGSSRDFGIIKFGNIEDHVATVHGFADDYMSCKEIVDALNTNACKETGGEGCLNPYSCRVLN